MGKGEKASELLGLIRSDVYGPMMVYTKGDFRILLLLLITTQDLDLHT